MPAGWDCPYFSRRNRRSAILSACCGLTSASRQNTVSQEKVHDNDRYPLPAAIPIFPACFNTLLRRRLPGFRIERVRFSRPCRCARALGSPPRTIEAAGRPPDRVLSCELRSPAALHGRRLKKPSRGLCEGRWSTGVSRRTARIRWRAATSSGHRSPAEPGFQAFAFTIARRMLTVLRDRRQWRGTRRNGELPQHIVCRAIFIRGSARQSALGCWAK